MDSIMNQLRQNGDIREDSPIVTSVGDGDYMFESPIYGDCTTCTISGENYDLLTACNIDKNTIGNILLLLCKQLGTESIDFRYDNGGSDGYVALSIIVGLRMFGDSEEKFMEAILKMSREQVTSLFLNGNYIYFKNYLR